MELKHMEIVQDVDKLKVDLQATFMKYSTIKKWAYIVHDKDDTRPHYHIYIHFGGSSVDTKLVASWFQLGYTDKDGVEHDGTQFIEKVKGRKQDILLYLIHGNDSQKHKHPYSPNEVHANFDFTNEVQMAKILGDFDKYSYAQQLAYIDTLPVTEKPQAFSKLEKLWKLQCQLLTLNSDRQLQVIFVTGKGGTGKTYYAKKILDDNNFDYCVSSSSNDPFQDYMGQRAIILDDLRDKSFEFEDLLKVLDNDTASSVKSRFTNKVFNGDIIIITSSVPLVYWYKHGSTRVDFDELTQLYRRIGSYVVVTDDDITVYDGVDEVGKPKGLGVIYKNNLIKNKSEKKPKLDINSTFSRICKDDENNKIF